MEGFQIINILFEILSNKPFAITHFQRVSKGILSRYVGHNLPIQSFVADRNLEQPAKSGYLSFMNCVIKI